MIQIVKEGVFMLGVIYWVLDFDYARISVALD
jgi:hypothetical protein